MNVYLEDVGSDCDSHQWKQNQGQDCSICVHHAIIFFTSSETSKESDYKHYTTNDNQNYVDVRVTEEVQYVYLNVNTNANESNTRREKNAVEEKNNVLDHSFTTTHVGWLWNSEIETNQNLYYNFRMSVRLFVRTP